jgi:hypothetical protein
MKPEIALADFQRGRDTLQIARVHNEREADVYNMLAQRPTLRQRIIARGAVLDAEQDAIDRAYERSIQGDKP